ncbi:hypothetical protein PsYK624_129890 [Phanerochaete sordida]|uniref:Uncharacterized protein n=1 Tax=Phanerochaete sordida TaxID=48140 RepID=A0A9P3GIZ2_9APHY|nr:hypothetical protein PsYK624_129890 [Phanerochaete sordida]
MFSLPANPEVNEILDGVPVVRMQDDANELAALISTFYDPVALELRNSDRHRTRLRALLSLSTKYQADRTRAHAVKFLESEWPKTLEDWFLHQSQMSERVRYSKLVRHYDFDYPAEHFFPEPAADLRLAIDFQVPSILPTLYYRLAISDTQIDFDQDFESQGSLSANWKLLQARDWMRVTRGKGHLLKAAELITDIVIQLPSPRCQEREACKKAVYAQAGAIHIWDASADFARQPDIIGKVFGILDSLESYASGSSFCCSCEYSFQESLRRFLNDTWEELADTFDLASEGEVA